MSRSLYKFAILLFVITAILTLAACSSEQQAQNEVVNSVDATADAARLKVSQFTGYAQSLVDQLVEQVGETPTTVAAANEIKYALDDVDAALQAVINALENDKFESLKQAQNSLEQAIDVVSSIAEEAENPEVKASLNEMTAGLEDLKQTVIDLINEQAQ